MHTMGIFLFSVIHFRLLVFKSLVNKNLPLPQNTRRIRSMLQKASFKYNDRI